MSTSSTTSAGLAYERAGTGTPVVLLHGLTFDRTTWRPVVAELGTAVQTIAIDLPAHGESPGPPMPVEQLAACLHDHIVALDIPRPLVVGHSFGAAVASMYVARYPAVGLAMVDSGPEQQPFAELVQRAASKLRGPGFAEAWSMIEASLGLELIPEPTQSLARASHRVQQDVILDYWEQMLDTPPAEFQAYIDSFVSQIDVPVLAVYGRAAPEGDRQRFEQLPDVRLEEYPGNGHFVHLVDPARFARILRQFITHGVTAA
jgi:pimeloyl-ACP methyl ester carboxylesterase